MFERNDRSLRRINTIFTVCVWVAGVMSVAVGILATIVLENLWYLLLVFFAPVLLFLIVQFQKLCYSFLCDVKLIRNKLYNESNDGLNDFLMSYKEQIDYLDNKDKIAELEEAKLALKELYEKDMIEKEEYEKQKKELEKREKSLNIDNDD